MSQTLVKRLNSILYISIIFSLILCVSISGIFVKNRYDTLLLETHKSTNLMFNTFRFILLDTDMDKSISVLKYYSNITDIKSIVIYDMYDDIFIEYIDDDISTSTITLTIPLYNKDILIGKIELTISIKKILQSILSDIVLLMLLFVFFNICITILIQNIIKTILKPLKSLTQHITEVMDDRYSCIVNIEKNEIGDLINLFNDMITSLHQKDITIKNHTNILQEEIENQTKRIKTLNSLYANILNTQNDLIARVDLDNTLLYANKNFIDTFNVNDITRYNCFHNIHIYEDDMETFENAYYSVMCDEPYRLNVIFRCYINDEIRWFNWEASGIILNDKMSEIQIIGKDITEQKQNEEQLYKNIELDKSANKILTKISKRKPLKEILNDICLHIEKHDPNISSSILLYDKESKMLFQGASPSLPDDYNELIVSGLPIGEGIGSCGTAGYRKQFFITEDIQNSPNWIPYTAFIEKTKKYNLNACWSYPIINENNELMAIIANYSKVMGMPADDNEKFIEWGANILKVLLDQYNHDIEVERFQSELNEQNRQYKILIESLNDCVYRLDNDFRFVFISNRIENILGHKPDDVIGKELKEVFIPIENMPTLSNDDFFTDVQLMGFHIKTNEFVSLEFDIQPYVYKNEHLGYQGIIKDITKEKQLKEQIEYSDKMMVNVMNSSPLALLILDDKYNILYRNNKANEINLPIIDNILKLDKLVSYNNHINNNVDNSVIIESVIDDQLYDFIFKRISYDFKDCNIVFIRNIEDKRKIQEELNRKVKERTYQLEKKTKLLETTNNDLEQFAYIISHDLKSPLRNLNSNVNIIKKTMEVDDKLSLRLNKIEDLSIKIGGLIDGILKLSRNTQGVVNRREYDMISNIKTAFNTYKNTYKLEKAQLIIPDTLVMNCDIEMMSVVFDNLINNGLKFSQDKEIPTIEIGINDKNEYYVKDNGNGISKDVPQDELFKIFKTTKDKYSGTGIGLSTVHRIITKHEGYVYYESEEDKGTTFFFMINQLENIHAEKDTTC